MNIRFWGGADTVTGSQHLFEVGGRKVLRDCGLFQGRRKESEALNRTLAYDARQVDAVVVSHAHIDHCGNLPTLVRSGFSGSIHCTGATQQLLPIMLRDAARIQEQDAAYLNQKTNRVGKPRVEPLYTMADAEGVFPLLRGYNYGDMVDVVPGVKVSFVDAGHILGSALTVFELEENTRRVRVGVAVDLGRKNLPLIRDPQIMSALDVLVVESTYGNRFHHRAEEAGAELYAAIKETHARGGKVIIPSFALERAQEVIFHINQFVVRGMLPKIPIYVDSPMAAAVSRVFDKNELYLDDETKALGARMGSVMDPAWVHYINSVEDSKRVTASDDPCVVIAASGMCEHGRILHHLKHGIENARHTIVIVGYQAENTLGRRLVEGERRVRIFGDWFERQAEVRVLNAFSAHADKKEMTEYIEACAVKRLVLVHGEPGQRTSFADYLRGRGYEVDTPSRGDSVQL